jgi:hypothetical protein
VDKDLRFSDLLGRMTVNARDAVSGRVNRYPGMDAARTESREEPVAGSAYKVNIPIVQQWRIGR